MLGERFELVPRSSCPAVTAGPEGSAVHPEDADPARRIAPDKTRTNEHHLSLTSSTGAATPPPELIAESPERAAQLAEANRGTKYYVAEHHPLTGEPIGHSEYCLPPDVADDQPLRLHDALVAGFRQMARSVERRMRRRGHTRSVRSARSRGAGRPKGRRSSSTRSSARSGDSCDDGESEPAARLCACGCGRDISHKRAGAKTYDAACRKRLSRTDGATVAAAEDQVPRPRHDRAEALRPPDDNPFPVADLLWCIYANGTHGGPRIRAAVVA